MLFLQAMQWEDVEKKEKNSIKGDTFWFTQAHILVLARISGD